MKKAISIVLSLILMFTLFAVPLNVSAGGYVTEISSAADFLQIKDNPAGSYRLICSVDLSQLDYQVPEFSGSLDGNGYMLTTGQTSVFAVMTSSAVVQNLMICPGAVTGEENIGALAGVSAGMISGCAVSSQYGVSGKSNVGGIVGYMNGGSISDSYTAVDVKASDGTVGGLVGKAENAVIERCYSRSGVGGTSVQSGAVVGSASGTSISGCYASMDLSGQLLGVGAGSDTVTNLSPEDMTKAASFSGFDFNNTWTTVGDSTMPKLTAVNGSGTEKNPYRIHTLYDFETFLPAGCGAEGVNKYFRLENDLWSITRIGSDENRFNGIFDGNNHSLFEAGMFGAVGESGVVKNVILSNIDVSGANIFGCVAGINYGTIENCHAQGDISGKQDIGGIVGENINGTIRNCSFSSGSAIASSSGAGGIAGYNSYGTISGCSVKNSTVYCLGGHASGGITGDCTGGTIENCLAFSVNGMNSYTGSTELGGIAGRLYGGTVRNCYSKFSVNPGDTAGAIVGAIIENGTIENCYYNSETTAARVGASEDITGALTNITSKDMSSFAGFDFDNIWTVDEDGDIALRAIKGDGTKQNPYILRFSQDLRDMGDGIGNDGQRDYYALNNNIRADETLYLNSFSGSLDGRGNEINLRRGNLDPMFKELNEGGYVGNLIVDSIIAETVEKAKIENCIVYGAVPAVSLAFSTMSNCAAVDDNELSNINGDIVGGLASNITGCEITNCCTMGMTVEGTAFAGGLVRSSKGSNITGCRVLGGAVSGVNAAGGIVGRNDNGSNITNCYTSAAVSGTGQTGAIAGMNYAQISGCSAYSTEGTPAAATDEGTITDTIVSAEAAAPTEFIQTAGKNVKVNDTTVYTPVQNTDAGAEFSDISGHWAEKTIKHLVEIGTVNGYEDGTYRPENSVTKGEFIKLLMSVTQSGTSSNFTLYRDVNSSWARGYVSRALELGLCENINNDESMFGVEDPIDRAEAAALMGRLLAGDKHGAPQFTDSADIPSWSADSVYACVELGLITGNDDGSFKPLNNLTRAEAATIIERILNL